MCELERHARKLWSERAKRRVAAGQRFECPWCGTLLGHLWAADHIVPLREGGTNALANCQILHVECHAEKTLGETGRAADRARERRTGQSKYWDPRSQCSVAFHLLPVSPTPGCRRWLQRRQAWIKSAAQ